MTIKLLPFLLRALLLAAPVFSQQAPWLEPRLSANGTQWFQLVETESEVRKRLGQPQMVADFGEYRSWQYQIGEVDHDDFSHALVFRRADGQLVSISRNYNPERNVDMFFPASETTVHWFHATGQPDFPMRLRKLPGGRLLIAIGTSKAGQTTGQLVLMRETELEHFYPWLKKDLARQDAGK